MRCLEALAPRSLCWHGRALGQPQVDQDLGPAGIRKELLLHLAHAGHAGAQR
jgi:hypothetical protein